MNIDINSFWMGWLVGVGAVWIIYSLFMLGTRK